eukprot:7566346-Pyramimonas_sp.AAC.1
MGPRPHWRSATASARHMLQLLQDRVSCKDKACNTPAASLARMPNIASGDTSWPNRLRCA